MWLLWGGVILAALKLLDVQYAAELSWWIVLLPFALAFLWFELEERLGLDKKKAVDEIDKGRKRRIARQFKETRRGR
jgi:small Trp-rich protein